MSSAITLNGEPLVGSMLPPLKPHLGKSPIGIADLPQNYKNSTASTYISAGEKKDLAILFAFAILVQIDREYGGVNTNSNKSIQAMCKDIKTLILSDRYDKVREDIKRMGSNAVRRAFFTPDDENAYEMRLTMYLLLICAFDKPQQKRCLGVVYFWEEWRPRVHKLCAQLVDIWENKKGGARDCEAAQRMAFRIIGEIGR